MFNLLRIPATPFHWSSQMNLSRRDFVDQSIMSAPPALAAGGAKTIFAEDSQATRKVGPNDKLRVAVIGCNGQGGAHIGEWMKNPDCDLVAVCDCDPNSYEKHAKRFKDMAHKPEYV